MSSRCLTALAAMLLTVAQLACAEAPVRPCTSEAEPATGDLHAAYRFPQTGETLRYRLYVPRTYDGSSPFPLVVVLHGYRGTPDSAFDEAPPAQRGILQREAERHDFIVLSPAGYTGQGDYGTHLPLKPIKGVEIRTSARESDLAEADVLDAMKDVEKRYRIDARRIYLMGNSMGMTGTLQLAQKYPGRWCAIGPSDGPPWPDFPVERLRGLSGAFFVNGGRDRIAPSAVNRQLAERVRSVGVDTRFVEVPQGEHGTAWYSALPQIFDFFAAHPCRADPARRVRGADPAAGDADGGAADASAGGGDSGASPAARSRPHSAARCPRACPRSTSWGQCASATRSTFPCVRTQARRLASLREAALSRRVQGACADPRPRARASRPGPSSRCRSRSSPS